MIGWIAAALTATLLVIASAGFVFGVFGAANWLIRHNKTWVLNFVSLAALIGFLTVMIKVTS